MLSTLSRLRRRPKVGGSSRRRKTARKGQPPRRRRSLCLKQYVQVSVGVATSLAGLALTVSALAVAYTAAAEASDTGGRTAGSYTEARRLAQSYLRPMAWAASGLTSGAEASATAGPLVSWPAADAASRQDTAGSSLEPQPIESVVTNLGLATPAATLPASDTQKLPAAAPVVRRIHNVSVTFYDCAGQGFCGAMTNGRQVYEGAAACSYDLPLGTRFHIHGDPTGRVYRCDDRGLLANTWVDVFWYYPDDGWDWQSAVGRYGTIDVIEWGTGR